MIAVAPPPALWPDTLPHVARRALGADPGGPAHDAALPGQGTLTYGVTAGPSWSLEGRAPVSFADDWYHRIHLIPARIDLGNLVQNQTRDVYLWNAHFTPKTLLSIGQEGALDGVALQGASAPIAFKPLDWRAWTLEARVTGSPSIHGIYRFDFGTEAVTLPVSGVRIVLWPIRPDWTRGITERLEWATDVLTARDGTEQRVRLRTNARRTLEGDYQAAGHDARIAESLLFGWGGRKYCLPVWIERDVLAAPVAAGTTAISVTDAAMKDYRVGGLVVLWASPLMAEAIEIEALSGDTLTLRTPVSRAYPAGASVCPGMIARIDGDAPVRRATDALFETRLRFLDEQAIDRAAAEIGPVWKTYAVLDERPDRAEDVTETWSRTLAILDSIAGIVAVEDTSGSPILRRS